MSEFNTPYGPNGGELESLKQENYERSLASGKIIIAGSLRDIAPGASWQGAISIDPRIDNGELTREDITGGFELVNGLYMPTGKKTVIRCGDERADEGYDDSDVVQYDAPLGPQVLGGHIGVAHAYWLYRLVREPGFDGRLVDMLPSAREIIEAAGYAPGVHGDDLTGKAGCGDAKSKEGQLIIISSGKQGFFDLVEAYRGENFSAENFSQIAKAARKGLDLDGVPAPEVLIDAACDGNNSVYSRKIGKHLGVGVVKNNVAGTTLHTNHMNALTDGKKTFFGVDAWFDGAMARAISNDRRDQALFEDIRSAQTIATSMMLKDGSLYFGERVPS